MAALTSGRDTPRKLDGFALDMDPPVAASTKIYQGAIVCLNAAGGLAVPGATATTLRCLGVADALADNSAGGASAITVSVRRGVFRMANSSAGDLIAQVDVGNVCYIVDDQTVAKTDGGATRSKAGMIFQVDSDGVWVEMGLRGIGI